MRTTICTLAAAALAGGLASQSLPESGAVALKTKIQRRQKLLLPGEAATAVATGFHFEAGIGADFRADVDGESLRIDADGDGQLETLVEGDKGFVVLEHGDRRYGVSLVKKGEWRFVAGSVVQGELAGTKVRVVDQNHNGRFDDVGQDAMVIGNGRAASFLSEVVSIDGQLRPCRKYVAVRNDGRSTRVWALIQQRPRPLSMTKAEHPEVVSHARAQRRSDTFLRSTRAVVASLPSIMFE